MENNIIVIMMNVQSHLKRRDKFIKIIYNDQPCKYFFSFLDNAMFKSFEQRLFIKKKKKKGMTSEINKHKDTFKYTYF